jgi:hypothetical protein
MLQSGGEGVFAISTGLHSESLADGASVSGQFLATGFVTADIFGEIDNVILESGYLFELALRVDWALELEEGIAGVGFAIMTKN